MSVRSLWAALLVTALVASPARAEDQFECAGLTSVPDGWTQGSDRDGNAVIFTESGEMIWCDGVARSSDGPPNAVLGVTAPPNSTFEAPFGLEGIWTMVGTVFVPTVTSDAIGYLGSSADLRTIYWRSSSDGPMEIWSLDENALTE